MPDGLRPVPGGWNRIQLQVSDLASEGDRLHAAGLQFHNRAGRVSDPARWPVREPGGALWARAL